MVNLNSKNYVQKRLLVAEWANDCQDLLEYQTYVFKTSFTTKKICSNFDLKRHCLVQFLTSIWICVSVNSQLQKIDVFHEEWHFFSFPDSLSKSSNSFDSSTLTSSFKQQVIAIHSQPQGNANVEGRTPSHNFVAISKRFLCLRSEVWPLKSLAIF